MNEFYPQSKPNTNIFEIALTRGYVAIVDEVDADLAQYKWYERTKRGHLQYAQRTAYENDKQATVMLHRVILARVLGRTLGSREFVDHKDGNCLNNTRGNLRLATNAENCRNACAPKNNTSGFVGVQKERKCKTWRARITVNRKTIYLGSFDNIADAAAARAAAEIKYHGEFSALLSRPAASTQEVTQS